MNRMLAAAVAASAIAAGGAGFFAGTGSETVLDVEGCEFYNIHTFESGAVEGEFLCLPPTSTPSPVPSPTSTSEPSATPQPSATSTPITGLTVIPLPSPTATPTAIPPTPTATSVPLPSPTSTPTGSISNPNGDCVVARSGQVIENLTIGPCGRHGILAFGVSDVTIRNVTIRETGPSSNGILVQASERVHISDVTVIDSGRQLVLFNNSSDSSLTRANVGVEDAWPTRTGWDGLSAYASRNITIQDSEVRGGDLSSGCGIIVDGFSGFVGSGHVFRNNVIDNMNNCGVGIAGGTDILVEGNQVGRIGTGGGSVGYYVWDFYRGGSSLCGGVVFRNNSVTHPNPYWDAGNCGVVELEGNSWQN